LGDLDQEQRTYQVWEQTYPRDWMPRNKSAVNLLILGEYDRALTEAHEALRLNPDHADNYLNVGLCFLFLNRKDEAKQVARQALSRGLDIPVIRMLLYQAAFLENDTKGMGAQLTAVSGKPGEGFVLASQSVTEAYFGRMKTSRQFSSQAVEMTKRVNFNEVAAVIVGLEALREAEFGNSDRAKQVVAAALTLSSGGGAKVFASAALAPAGDATRAKALANELSKRFPWDTMLKSYWLPTIRGSIQLAKENPAGALSALQGLSYELSAGLPAAGYGLYPVYVRGQTYLMTREGKEAAAEFQKILDHRFIVLNSPTGALAHLGLGRAYALQGDTARARRAYQDFFALWKDADPDIPILMQAKAEYAKLK
jgi:tetratricopeptide (TPR) repeat protein